MTAIYYFLAIFLIWMELQFLISPREKTKEIQELSELEKIHRGKKWKEFPKEYKEKIKSNSNLGFVFLWLFIGLFTFQWVAYLAMLSFRLLIISPLSKLTRYSNAYIVIHWINSLIGLCFGLYHSSKKTQKSLASVMNLTKNNSNLA